MKDHAVAQVHEGGVHRRTRGRIEDQAHGIGLAANAEHLPAITPLCEQAYRRGIPIIAATGYHRDAHYPDGHWVHDATVETLAEDEGFSGEVVVEPDPREAITRALGDPDLHRRDFAHGHVHLLLAFGDIATWLPRRFG